MDSHELFEGIFCAVALRDRAVIPFHYEINQDEDLSVVEMFPLIDAIEIADGLFSDHGENNVRIYQVFQNERHIKGSQIGEEATFFLRDASTERPRSFVMMTRWKSDVEPKGKDLEARWVLTGNPQSEEGVLATYHNLCRDYGRKNVVVAREIAYKTEHDLINKILIKNSWWGFDKSK